MFNTIAVSGGHSANCLGAVSYVNEYEECQKIASEVMRILKLNGKNVIDCNSNARTENGELSERVRKANNSGADFMLDIHLDAYKKDTAFGCTAYILGFGGRAENVAYRLTNNVSQLYFHNRGVKTANYYVLRNTNMPCVLLEVCFCDNMKDVWNLQHVGYTAIATEIVKAILNVSSVDVGGGGCNVSVDIPNGDVHGRYKVTANGGLNVRDGRGTNCNIIGNLTNGTIVEPWYCLNGWVSFSFKNTTGYISSKYLTKI